MDMLDSKTKLLYIFIKPGLSPGSHSDSTIPSLSTSYYILTIVQDPISTFASHDGHRNRSPLYMTSALQIVQLDRYKKRARSGCIHTSDSEGID
jgi:hypothetical protein